VSLFGPLLPADVVLEEGTPEAFGDDLAQLTAAEAAAMERAVSKRRREYTAGRVLARRAAGRMGLGSVEILAGPDRAPRWPPGVVGSITHTRGHVAVALARSDRRRGLGLDVEQAAALKPRLWDAICAPEDVEMLGGYPPALRGELAKVVFSAKEAAYKAQYAVTQQYLGFAAMHIELSPTPEGNVGEFVATFRQTAGSHFRIGDRVVGRWRRVGPLLATAVALD